MRVVVMDGGVSYNYDIPVSDKHGDDWHTSSEQAKEKALRMHRKSASSALFDDDTLRATEKRSSLGGHYD